MITAADTIVLSLFFLITVSAQSPPAPPPPYTFDPSPATIAVVILSAVFFVVMFSLYLRLCSGSSTALLANASLRRRASTGLDDTTIASFPVLHYSEIQEHKIGKNALECAICLNEFEDDETLRLIPKCDHVFHPDCIDEWLGSHVTCPVCRANLLPNLEKPDTESCQPCPEDTTEIISVRVVPQEVVDPDPPVQPLPDQSLSRRFGFVGKFPRSHSTGHSLVVVQPGDNTDRFTLRLPNHIRKEVMVRALSRTATFSVREGSSRHGRRTGEGSSRGARSYKRLDREVKSDRWIITVPFFTSQGRATAGDGEGSTGRGVRTAKRLPSFKCLEPSASGDVVNAGAFRQAA